MASEEQPQSVQVPPRVEGVARVRLLARAVGVSLLAVALFFGAYEVVERTWLPDTNPRLLHTLHILRGVLAALLSAAVVVWQLFRFSEPFLQAPPVRQQWATTRPETEEEKFERYAFWLIEMRWIAVLAAGTLIFLGVKVVAFLTPKVGVPLASTLVFLAVLNLVHRFLLRRRKSLRLSVELLVLMQVFLDLVVLAVLLHYSGGFENPLCLMAIFHVVFAGTLFRDPWPYIVAGTALGLLAIVGLTEWAEITTHHLLGVFPHEAADGHVLAHAAHYTPYVLSQMGVLGSTLFIAAYIVSNLAERTRSYEAHLQEIIESALSDRQLLEQAIETTDTGLRVIDDSLRYTLINARWREWFHPGRGRPGEKIPDEEWEDSPAQQTMRDGVIRVSERAVPPEPAPTEIPSIPRKDRRFFQVTTAPLLGAGGGVRQVVELAHEVTEQKQIQAQLLQAGKMAAVGELAGNVAHEVNNPIGIISAKGRLLLSDHKQDMSEKVASEIQKITDAADRVAHIAHGLLSYCRPSAAARSPLDLRVPVRKALAMVEHRAKKGNVRIEENFAEVMHAVRANANEMEQVFLNLFLNALDAMPEGGVLKLSGRLSRARGGDRHPGVEITVQDTGTGIPPEMQEQIFEPFFTTKEEGKGTGLGLSICMGLMHSNGGGIDVTSEPGRGTTFTLRFPSAEDAASQGKSA